MYLIGILVYMLGLYLFMVFKGIPLSILANPSAISIMFFSLVAVTVSVSGVKPLIAGLNAVMSKDYVISDENREKAAKLFRLYTITALVSALIVILLSTVSTMSFISDIERLAHAIAASCIAPVLGCSFVAILFEPAIFILRHRQEGAAVEKAYPKHLGDKLLELCKQNGLSEEEIENATSIILKRD